MSMGNNKGPFSLQVRSCAAAASAEYAHRAAALVIGDEILSGAIQDSNTPWLAKMLHSQGVDMVRFEYVLDEKEVIIEALRRLKRAVGEQGVIFTSGANTPQAQHKATGMQPV